MERYTLSEIQAIRESMRQEMLVHLPTFKLLAQYIAPSRIRENPEDRTNKNWQTRRILKNQGGMSLRTFGAGMSNGATPRTRPWNQYRCLNDRKNSSSTARKYFSSTEKIVNNFFQMGNLYEVFQWAHKEVGLFSNAAYGMLPHHKYGFFFYPFPLGTYGFACDIEGNPEMFYRDFTYTVRQVVMNYAKLKDGAVIDWSNIPSYIKERWDNAQYQELVTISNVILPNCDYDPKKLSLDGSHKRYQSYHFILSMASGLPVQSSNGARNEVAAASPNKTEFLRVGGHDYFPVIIDRWETIAEQGWGIEGPGEMALGEIMGLQEMQKYRLEAIAKLVKPPMVGPAALRRHMASILAGGMTYLDETAGQQFRPVFEIDPKLSELITDQMECKNAIKDAFYDNVFNLFSGQESKTHVTVEEIREKAGERMVQLSPALSSLDRSRSRLMNNAHFILEDAGILDPRPKELEGEEFRPQYISILHQAAKASQMTSIERGINFAASLATTVQDPAILKMIKSDNIARRYLVDVLALDPDDIATEDEMKKIRGDLMKQQQQQSINLQLQQQAEIAKNLSDAKIGEGSMLDAQLEAAGS